MNVHWLPPLAAVLCCLLTIEHAWSRDHATSSATTVLPPPGQRCGTVYLNSFDNRTSPSDSSNDRWKHLCLASWAAVPCVWTLRAPTRNLLTYLLTLFLCFTSCDNPEYERSRWSIFLEPFRVSKNGWTSSVIFGAGKRLILKSY